VEAFLAYCHRTFIAVHSTLLGQLVVTGKGLISGDLKDLNNSSGEVELQIDYFIEGSDWTGAVNLGLRGDPAAATAIAGYRPPVQTSFELHCSA
jgi:hypothetical protein